MSSWRQRMSARCHASQVPITGEGLQWGGTRRKPGCWEEAVQLGHDAHQTMEEKKALPCISTTVSFMDGRVSV